VQRRTVLVDRIKLDSNVKCLFIESICSEGPILAANIEMKLKGPDYIDIDPEKAIIDFKTRIANYEKVYQTLGDTEEQSGTSFIKVLFYHHIH
jgi:6-phosphofructo-2-kinase